MDIWQGSFLSFLLLWRRWQQQKLWKVISRRRIKWLLPFPGLTNACCCCCCYCSQNFFVYSLFCRKRILWFTKIFRRRRDFFRWDSFELIEYKSDRNQGDQMDRLFFNFWWFTTMKACHFDEMFAKVGWKFCQILNKPSKDSQKVLNLCQSGEISPNLVTLIETRNERFSSKQREREHLPNDEYMEQMGKITPARTSRVNSSEALAQMA